MLLRRVLQTLLLLAATVPAVALASTHVGLDAPVVLPQLTNGPVSFQISFTDALLNFSSTSLALQNATVSNEQLSGNSLSFAFTLNPVADGVFGFAIPQGTVGNNNLYFEATSTYDATPPALTFYSTTTGPTASPVFYLATSSEPVTGFDANDIAVTNGTLSNFIAASSTGYSFLLTGFADGLTTIEATPGKFFDLAGNANTATSTASYGYFNFPTTTITILDSGGNAPPGPFAPGAIVQVSAAFSEPIDASSTVLAGVSGTDTLASTSMSRIDATHYAFSYTVFNAGIDTVSIGGGLDLAGNAMIANSTAVSIVRPSQGAAAQGSGGGGGGGGGGASPPVAHSSQPPAAVPASPGETLGVATYHFTLYLTRGSSGDEVQNLQGVLIAAGFLAEDNLSGYFGPATQKAVAAYQKAHNLTQSGTVGPLTRALLNKELPAASAPAAVLPAPKKAPSLTQMQIDAIVALVKAFGGDAKVVANVIAALGK